MLHTAALYDEDSHLREFDARVLACTACDGGFDVILDRTAFFPEGGGQGADHGMLGQARVCDVRRQNGEILHRVDCALPVGAEVHGVLDWARRFDLMQQHSGEHLVSGLVHNQFGYDNVGFHLGSDVMTIDFNGMLTMEQLRQIQDGVNAVIWQNLEVKAYYPDSETLAKTPYRSKKELTEAVRLVEYPGVDICACCGTHVRHTGEIGLVLILSCVKFRQGVRVELVCGQRAYAHLYEAWEQNRQIGALLSAQPWQTALNVTRLQAELEQTRYQLTGCQNRLLHAQAQAFAGQKNALLFADEQNPDLLRKLAGEIAEQVSGTAAVLCGRDGKGYAYALASKQADAAALAKQMNAALSGRGGGRGGFAQGKIAAERREIEAFFADLG